MRVSYIGHASICIETANHVILFDPWAAGPAYCRQWNIFPQPVDTSAFAAADTVVISHAHEDHLHEPTLRTVNRSARLFYPYYWYGETIDWLRSFGFRDVVEAHSHQPYELSDGTKLTFVVNGQDCIIVVESGGFVVMNVNDALHSCATSVIDLYTRRLKERWPKIDVVFCGFGGASYYPNTIHMPHERDVGVARLREQLFVHNFCKIVSRLRPQVAVPFAADFVLLAPEQRWINDARFSRERIPDYYRRHFEEPVRILPMYPGDRLDDLRLVPASPYRRRLSEQGLHVLLDEQYPTAVSALAADGTVDENGASRIADDLARHLTEQARFQDRETIRKLSFAIRLIDVASRGWYCVSFHDGRARVTRQDDPPAGAGIRLRTSAAVLCASIDSDWGGDAVIIGYGCEAHGTSGPGAERSIKTTMELLCRHPRPEVYALRHPLRMLKYVLQSAFAVRERLARKLGRGVSTPSAGVDEVGGLHWLRGDAAEIRRICGLPAGDHWT